MHTLSRTGITISGCGCAPGMGCGCENQLGAADSAPSSSSAVPKIIAATMFVGLAGAWAIWFIATHPLKPEYVRAGARF